MMLLGYQWNWESWVQHQARDEGDKRWARERDQSVKIVGWHIRVREHRAGQAMPLQYNGNRRN